jgi:large subunit ribosomal protein L4
MKLKVYNSDATSSVEKDFDAIPLFEGNRGSQALKEVIVAINANARLGTHSTKTRGEVSGGGKKPWRQKGTGRARAGSIRSPLWVGGGVVFGPKPRDYSKKINTQVKSLAFSRALFDRAVAGEIDVIEKWEFAQSKTKSCSEVLSRIAPVGKILIVDDNFTVQAVRAARNIQRVTIQDASKLNSKDLAMYRRIIVSTKGLEKIITRANGGKN